MAGARQTPFIPAQAGIQSGIAGAHDFGPWAPRFRGDEREAVAMWRASVLTLFPEMFPGPLGISLAGKALAAGLWSLEAHDIRDAATDRHRTVDDTPAGGGPGMVMKADVLAAALDAIPADPRPRLLMSARGRPLAQPRVIELAQGPGAVILCGRFEGVDERLIAARGPRGGVARRFRAVGRGGRGARPAGRLRPAAAGSDGQGGLGDRGKLRRRPAGIPAIHPPGGLRGPGRSPDILTSGDHAKVAQWRRAEAERLTRERRPDLWAAYLARKRT